MCVFKGRSLSLGAIRYGWMVCGFSHIHPHTPPHATSRHHREHTTIKTAEQFDTEIQELVGRLKKELEACDNIYDEQKLQYRVAALSGGIAAIKCV